MQLDNSLLAVIINLENAMRQDSNDSDDDNALVVFRLVLEDSLVTHHTQNWNYQDLYLHHTELLPDPHESTSWQCLYTLQDDHVFITIMGFDVETFYMLFHKVRFANESGTQIQFFILICIRMAIHNLNDDSLMQWELLALFFISFHLQCKKLAFSKSLLLFPPQSIATFILLFKFWSNVSRAFWQPKSHRLRVMTSTPTKYLLLIGIYY